MSAEEIKAEQVMREKEVSEYLATEEKIRQLTKDLVEAKALQKHREATNPMIGNLKGMIRRAAERHFRPTVATIAQRDQGEPAEGSTPAAVIR